VSFTVTQRGLVNEAGVFEQAGTFIATSQTFSFEQTSTFGSRLVFVVSDDFGDRPRGGAFTMRRIVKGAIDSQPGRALKTAA
jgi:hypothetical protein